MKSVRWDEQNCDALCHGCHRFWEKEDRESYRAFKLKQLGQQQYNLLDLRAHTPQKVDWKSVAMYYEAKMKKEST